MNEQFLNIKKLFKEKKFTELVFYIETEFINKSSQIKNILAVARLLSQKNFDTYSQAIQEFKDVYLQEKHTQLGLEGLINYINALSDFYDFVGPFDQSKDFSNDFKEAIQIFKEAETFFGYNKDLISAIIRVFNRAGNLDLALNYYDLLYKNSDLNLKKASAWIFNNLYKKTWSQKDFFNFSKLLDDYSKKYPENLLTKLNNKKNKKIKIGFLSSDITKGHSITYFLKTVLKNYDKIKYEIILYINNIVEDETTKEFIRLADNYRNISSLDDISAINLIREDKVDVMIDLMGATSSNRIPLFKNRIAPTQVAWLGYCNTTGLKEMDYLIVDHNLVYQDEEKFYHERIIYLKDIWNCHSGFDFERLFNPSPLLENMNITFGSFNNFSKINDNVAEVWSNILKKIKGSKLLLKTSTQKNSTRIKEIFKNNLVDESVVFLQTQKSFKDHLNLYNQIDIALDTFPYNGVTTSFEAIWCGVPVLTMKGYNFNSRCGESINKNLDLHELIAVDEDDYVDKALKLSLDKKKLINLRKKIFEDSTNSPLFDQKKFSESFFSSIENHIKF